ncbi:hypothetical protein [Solwaraspora sp. WMMD792]|uniref:hypothetical protein n=1 Tax=Solwaraspora sp. WMMD792 TaxID=3016099 RepID=UPI002416C3AE|nr:hypothetical protein [Solwaraspora sp. WMMD792]MDG4770463.1 hypothetical protein [Solwaraspora sp. WMMD792]
MGLAAASRSRQYAHTGAGVLVTAPGWRNASRYARTLVMLPCRRGSSLTSRP